MKDITSHWNIFLKTGDKKSFSIIYDHYVDILYSYGLHLGFEEEVCKDAIQDVFYKLYTSHEKLEHVKNHTAYLFRSLRNRLIDLIRREKRTDNIEQIGEKFSINVTVLDDIIDTETANLLKEKVENMLKKLSGQQREAVYMRYMLELEYKEISDLLEIKPESARKLIYRAMEKLREQIKSENSENMFFIVILLTTNL